VGFVEQPGKRRADMFRKMVAVALGFAVLFAVAGNASAADPKETGPYLLVSGGYGLDYEGNIENLREDSVNGLNLGVRLGYDLNRYFGVELESGWSAFDLKTNEAEIKRVFGASGITDAGSLHVVPLLVNATAKYPMDKFVPYAVGGTGVFFFNVSESDQIKNVGAELDVDSTAYGFKAGAGLDYFLTENFALNLESGFWFILDPDASVRTSSFTVSGEADVDTWYVGGGLKYKF